MRGFASRNNVNNFSFRQKEYTKLVMLNNNLYLKKSDPIRVGEKYLFLLYAIPAKTFTQSQLELILSVSRELYSSMPKMEKYVYAR